MLSAWIPAEEKKASTVAPACSAHGVSHSGGTPALGGDVYVRITKTADYATALVGGFEAEADDKTAGNSVKLTNCQWGGAADANGVAELVILTRANA